MQYGHLIGWVPFPDIISPAYVVTDWNSPGESIPAGTVNLHPGPNGENSVFGGLPLLQAHTRSTGGSRAIILPEIRLIFLWATAATATTSVMPQGSALQLRAPTPVPALSRHSMSQSS